MKFEFDSEIKQLEGKIKWSVFYFPYSAAEHFGTKGSIPVCIMVDGHSFDHTLLPSKIGHYLVYNEFIKRAVGKSIGDTVHVALEKDTKKREIVIPADIEKALKDSGVLERFQSQPDYFKRELINHIETAKKEETRVNRINAIIRHAKLGLSGFIGNALFDHFDVFYAVGCQVFLKGAVKQRFKRIHFTSRAHQR